MRRKPRTGWVIYESPVHVRGRRLAVVCPQAEWDGMAADLRREYVLVRDGIATESEAERLARQLYPPTGRRGHAA